MKIHNVIEALQVHDSNIAGSQFTKSNIATSTFEDVDLRAAIFTDINLSQAKFSDINLTNVSIENANLKGMKINDVLVSDLFSAYQNRNRAAAVLFVKDVPGARRFYQDVAAMDLEHAQDDYVVLVSPTLQLVIHVIPADAQASINLDHPPHKTEAAIKLVFEVNSIAKARTIASDHGGEVFPQEREWTFKNYLVCDGCDTEGNVVQFWQKRDVPAN